MPTYLWLTLTITVFTTIIVDVFFCPFELRMNPKTPQTKQIKISLNTTISSPFYWR